MERLNPGTSRLAIWEFSGANSQFLGKIIIQFDSWEVFTGQIKESLCLEELNLLYQKNSVT